MHSQHEANQLTSLLAARILVFLQTHTQSQSTATKERNKRTHLVTDSALSASPTVSLSLPAPRPPNVTPTCHVSFLRRAGRDAECRRRHSAHAVLCKHVLSFRPSSSYVKMWHKRVDSRTHGGGGATGFTLKDTGCASIAALSLGLLLCQAPTHNFTLGHV